MNPKRNYQREMDDILHAAETPPHVLLHACCAPCSSAVLERMAEQAEITLFFYNPNILPEEEYRCRLEELKRLLSEMGLSERIRLMEGKYEPERFLAFAQALKDEPERGLRCQKCIQRSPCRTVQISSPAPSPSVRTRMQSLSTRPDFLWLRTSASHGFPLISRKRMAISVLSSCPAYTACTDRIIAAVRFHAGAAIHPRMCSPDHLLGFVHQLGSQIKITGGAMPLRFFVLVTLLCGECYGCNCQRCQQEYDRYIGITSFR